jgi:xylobiose transport system permease protein
VRRAPVSLPSTRVLSLTSQFQRNVPGTIMAVRLTARPVFVLYLVARRWLIAGSPR